MTKPYFYIIEHVATGKRYAGSRWEQGCDPSEFMQPGGYQTSSSTVRATIELEGLDSFQIVQIIPMENPYEYESKFLHDHDCAASSNWINKHNNDRVPAPWGSIEHKQLMLDKYGVEHNTHIPEVRAEMTRKQREFYKNNPDKVAARARKVADIKIKNGTTGKGTKRPDYSNNGLTGVWERSAEYCEMHSQRQKENSVFIKNNPMNDPEKRRLVSLSKIGKKKFMNHQTKEVKMCLPGTEPDGFVLAKKG
jgi:hypothetical protein